MAELRAVAGSAYGPDWEDRGRSGLAAAALLLASLWPAGGPAAVQGSAVHRISPRRRLPHGHIGAAKAAVMAGIVIVGVAVAAAVLLPRPTGHDTATGAGNGASAHLHHVDIGRPPHRQRVGKDSGHLPEGRRLYRPARL